MQAFGKKVVVRKQKGKKKNIASLKSDTGLSLTESK